MSRIIYQDDFVTEHEDGTEEVRFSDAEWALMMGDPARFGYVCPSGHTWSDDEREHGHCNACEHGRDDAEVSEEQVSEPLVEVASHGSLVETSDDDIPF